jgi:DeoR/GlpR family transcriptional regulator of sugar metabolism
MKPRSPAYDLDTPMNSGREPETRNGNEKLKAARQDMIVQEVLTRGAMTIAQLSEVFGVAEITIRRDLDELSEAGYLERIWGGVRAKASPLPEAPVLQRQKTNITEKRAIALEASQMIEDGDLISLYMGTTTLELARVLSQKAWTSLQVVTNGLPIVNELLRVPGIQLMCVGGLVDADEMAFHGVLTEQLIANIHINKLFIGCRGIDAQHGVTNAVQAEKELGTIKAFIRSSEQVILLADNSKFDHVFFMQAIALRDIDILVTDHLAPTKTLDQISSQGIEIRFSNAALS